MTSTIGILGIVSGMILGLTSGLAANAQTSSCDPGWEQINIDKSITVCSKKMADSSLLAFSGSGVINVPIAKVVQVLSDPNLNTDPDTLEDKVVTVLPGGDERVEYTATKLRWPAKSRDFVLDVAAQYDPSGKAVTINIHSLSDNQARALGVTMPPERSDRVRGEIIESYIKMKAIDNDTKTEIKVGIQTDPKGSIPKSIVNGAMKAWPVTAITSLATNAARPGVQDSPEVQAKLWGK